MVKPTSVNHIVVCTADMKAQLEFFTDVMGMELVAFFEMPNAEGCYQAFLKLNETCSFGLVFTPDTPKIKSIKGVTHAHSAAKGSAPGTVQHIAFNVDSMEAMLNLRDRIRSRGVNCIGPVDHGMCQSMYYAGPEHLTLEVATSDKAITPELWVDQEVVELAGISPEELKTFINPPAFTGQGGKVPQPKKEDSLYHLVYDGPHGDKILDMSDEELNKLASFPNAPNSDT